MLGVLLTCVPSREMEGRFAVVRLFQGTVHAHPEWQNCNISWEGASGPAGCSRGISAKKSICSSHLPSHSLIRALRKSSERAKRLPMEKHLECDVPLSTDIGSVASDTVVFAMSQVGSQTELACHMCHQRNCHVLAVIFVYRIRYCRFAVGPVCRD